MGLLMSFLDSIALLIPEGHLSRDISNAKGPKLTQVCIAKRCEMSRISVQPSNGGTVTVSITNITTATTTNSTTVTTTDATTTATSSTTTVIHTTAHLFYKYKHCYHCYQHYQLNLLRHYHYLSPRH